MISWVCGQNKTFEDVILNYTVDQTNNQLIVKIINRLSTNNIFVSSLFLNQSFKIIYKYKTNERILVRSNFMGPFMSL